jgi:hypothetical protein
MKRVKCFWPEPADRIRRSLRRYRSSDLSKCTGGEYSCHNASVFLDEVEDANPHGTIEADIDERKFKGDQRWLVKCESCDYQFTNADHFRSSLTASTSAQTQAKRRHCAMQCPARCGMPPR